MGNVGLPVTLLRAEAAYTGNLTSAIRRLVPGLLICLCSSAKADDPPPAQVLPQVEVFGSAERSARSEANAAKVIIGKKDIERFGDTSLADVLRRVQGVTVAGTGTQAGDIRVRGLGAGYTKLLVNGQPVPDGFSLGSLSPEVIERIEVIRSATADMSTQAVAGTIDIILKRPSTRAERAITLRASSYDGLGSGGLAGHWSTMHGPFTYALSGNLGYENNRQLYRSTLVSQHAEEGDFTRDTNTVENNKQWKLDLVPRFGWRASDDQQLTVDGLLQLQQLHYRFDDSRTGITGTPPSFMTDTLGLTSDVLQFRTTTSLKSRVGEHGRLDNKLTVSINKRTSDSLMRGFDGIQRDILDRSVKSVLNDRSVLAVGKYGFDLKNKHVFTFGWDGQYSRRTEDRIQRESSRYEFPTLDLDENYDATISRLALYVQDEWEMSSSLSTYLGLRSETLRTRTVGIGFSPVTNSSTVISPTLQILWKLPPARKDQLRLSLGRTYKAPTAKDLIPRRWVVMDNSASNPNFQGNPALRPELAWGLDVGFERYLGSAGFIGTNLYARRIDHVFQERVYNDAGTWVSTTVNNGSARVYGVEFEAKHKLKEWLAQAPDVDLRAGVTRNWSFVEKIPGPGNRIALQPPVTAGISADYKLAPASLTLGASFNVEKGGFARLSTVNSTRSNTKRKLDAYLLRSFAKGAQLRIALSNVTRPDEITQTQYDNGTLHQSQILNLPSHRVISIQLELKQ